MIDMEYETRTEAWAPVDSAGDDSLARSLNTFREWVASAMLADTSADHGQRIYLPIGAVYASSTNQLRRASGMSSAIAARRS